MFRNIVITFTFMIIFTIYVVDGKHDDEYYKESYKELLSDLNDSLPVKDFQVKNPKEGIDEIIYSKNMIHKLPSFELVDSNYANELNNEYNYTNDRLYFTSEVEFKYEKWYRDVIGMTSLKASIKIKIPVQCNMKRSADGDTNGAFKHGIFDLKKYKVSVKFPNKKCESYKTNYKARDMIKRYTAYSTILEATQNELQRVIDDNKEKFDLL